jgi:16S rRNA (guanine966-N2)-methyltransferase
MRVVAGEFRGRRLTAPASPSTRPTTDRVREAIFNALTSIGVVDGALVADLFAGSGALGIEALSRGAEHCTFVESDRHALSAIHDNIATLGLTGRTRVMSGDVLTMLPRIDCDLAFADPPYEFSDWPRLLDLLRAGLLVAEAAAAVDAADGWERQRVKRYGRTWVTFLERR